MGKLIRLIGAAMLTVIVLFLIFVVVPNTIIQGRLERALRQIRPGMSMTEAFTKLPGGYFGTMEAIVDMKHPCLNPQPATAISTANNKNVTAASHVPSPKAVELVASARAAMRDSHPDEAVRLAEQAIAVDPHYVDAYAVIDDVRSARGEWDTIAKSWSRLIALEPDNARALCERGGALSHIHNPENGLKAMQDGKHACSIDPTAVCCSDLRAQGIITTPAPSSSPFSSFEERCPGEKPPEQFMLTADGNGKYRVKPFELYSESEGETYSGHQLPELFKQKLGDRRNWAFHGIYHGMPPARYYFTLLFAADGTVQTVRGPTPMLP